MTDLDAVGVARVIADALADAAIPYAVGGALALAYWGAPRGTLDVDVNVFVDVDSADQALASLAAAGVVFNMEHAREQLKRSECVTGKMGDVPVDVFFNSIPLHVSAAERVAARPLLGRPAMVLSAEDLTVLKLLFFRGKDLVDVERLLALQRATLDRGYVRRWLVDCVGEDDVRVEKWDALSRQLP